mmetsp:Transcript_21491/g.48470  ORF Transcript_21491/g.48470 Transcript_21491/m.48470 type:complete len:133 (+) Transcript_21491:1-399(+)
MGKPAEIPMRRTRVAMYSFVAFTIIQLLVMLFFPVWYDGMAPGLDLAPHFAACRVIALKEVGLMTVYSVGTAIGDARFVAVTILGRCCVLPFWCWMVLGLGAPPSFFWGCGAGCGWGSLDLLGAVEGRGCCD